MATVGEGTFGAITLNCAVVIKDHTEAEIARMNDKTLSEPLPTRLSNFVADPCLVVYGEEISRRTVIKYVANKLGGVHYDTNRGSQTGKPKDVRVAQHFAYLDTLRSGEWAERTGMAGVTLGLAGKDSVYFMLMTFTQALRSSPDINSFTARAREMA